MKLLDLKLIENSDVFYISLKGFMLLSIMMVLAEWLLLSEYGQLSLHSVCM